MWSVNGLYGFRYHNIYTNYTGSIQNTKDILQVISMHFPSNFCGTNFENSQKKNQLFYKFCPRLMNLNMEQLILYC